MPVLCMFYGIIVRMYRELGGKHNIPHIHVEYSGQEAVIGLDGTVLEGNTLRKYFPRSYTPKQMEDTIIKLLEQWQRKQQRQNER